MKHYILYLFLFFAATLYGQDTQFRMSSNGIISWTVLTDSTYSATINLNSDQTGGSFNGTHVVDTFRLFTDAQAVYTVDSVMSALLSTVTIRVKEFGSTNGTPTGQVLIYNPDGGTAIPSVPVGNSGATDKMQAAIISYNSKVSGGSIASVNGDTGPTVVLDPDDFDDTSTTHKFTSQTDIDKLAGIDSGATDDQTPTEIKAALETLTDASRLDYSAIKGDTVKTLVQDSILVSFVDGAEVGRDTIRTSGGSGAADGVATSGSYSDITEQLTINVDSPGSNFNVDLNNIATDDELTQATGPILDSLGTHNTRLSALENAAPVSGGTGEINTWSVDTTYSEKDLVIYDGLIYQSLLDDDNIGNRPDTSTIHWNNITIVEPASQSYVNGVASNDIYTSRTGSLSAALALVSSTRRVIHIDDSISITSNTTVPDSVELVFTPSGIISIDTLVTLTLDCAFYAGRYKIFDLSAGGEIDGNTPVTQWYASWFGEIADDGNYDNYAHQYCAYTIANTGGGDMILSAGVLDFQTNTIIPSNVSVKGQGMGVTILQAPSDSLETIVPTVFSKAYGRFAPFQVGDWRDVTHDVHFSDFSVYQKANEYGYAHIIRLTQDQGSLEFTCNAIVAEYPQLSGGIPADSCYNISIRNVEARNVDQAFILGIRGQGPSDPWTGGYGKSHNIVIENCKVDSVSNNAIEVHQAYNVRINDNEIVNAHGGIQLDRFTRYSYAENNNIEFDLRGIVLGGGAQYCEVNNNVLYYGQIPFLQDTLDPLPDYIGQAAIYIRQESETDFENAYCNISNNIFDLSELQTVKGRIGFGVGLWSERVGTEMHNISFSNNHYINAQIMLGNVGFEFEFDTYNFFFNGEVGISGTFAQSATRNECARAWTFSNCNFQPITGSDVVLLSGDSVYYYNCDFAEAYIQFDSLYAGNNRFFNNIVKDTIFPILDESQSGNNAFVDPVGAYTTSGLIHHWTSSAGIIDTVGGSPDGKLDVWEDQIGSIDLVPRYTADSAGRGAGALITTSRYGHPTVLFDDDTDNGMSAQTTILADSFSVVCLAGNLKADQAEVLWAQGNGKSSGSRGVILEQSMVDYLGSRTQIGGTVTQKAVERNPVTANMPWFVFTAVTNRVDEWTIYDNQIDTSFTDSYTKAVTPFNLGIRDDTDLEGELHVIEVLVYDRPLSATEVNEVRLYWRRQYGFLFNE